MVQHIENEEDLLARARAGEAEAFATLIRWYESHLYRLALAVLGNREEAEDIVQEALLKAYTNLRRFRGGSRFYTWLVRIVINEGLMRLRARRRFTARSLDAQMDLGQLPRQAEHWVFSPERRFVKKELQKILTRAVLELPPHFRIVFLLRDVEGFSTEEVAGMVGISRGAVKSRLLRARIRLRLRLHRYFRRKRIR